MRRHQAALAACLITVSLTAATQTAPGVTPGRWDSTGTVTAVEMPGMPPDALAMMKRRPINHSYCVTKADAESGSKGLFSEGNGDCAYEKFAMANGRLNAAMLCKGPQGNARLTMLGSYTATTYETANITVMDGPQGKMRMTTKMRGKRVGDC